MACHMDWGPCCQLHCSTFIKCPWDHAPCGDLSAARSVAARQCLLLSGQRCLHVAGPQRCLSHPCAARVAALSAWVGTVK